MTKNAERIRTLVEASRDHMTAEDIYAKLREEGERVSLATVYNSLTSLCREGFVRKITMDGGPDRYDRTQRHDHLVCRKCGKISDILLEDLTAEIARQLPVQMLSYDLKVSYLCDDCRGAHDAANKLREEQTNG